MDEDGYTEDQVGDRVLHAIGDCTVTLTENPVSPVVVGASVTLTAVANCTGMVTPEYRFWGRDPITTNWIELRAYGTNGVFVWDTTGENVGDWSLQVWARRVGETFPWEGSDTVSPYTVDPPPSCPTVDFNPASPLSPQTAGTAVTLSATATCNGAAVPEYKFYQRDTVGVWTLAQDWSASDTYNWDTTGETNGLYFYQVWTRYIGNTVRFEDWHTQSYTIADAAETCGTTNITDVSPTSPQDAGTMIAFTASAMCSGAGVPEFRWLVRDTMNVWTELSAYSASTMVNWDTTGLTAGSYRIQAWARAQGSTVQNDSYDSVNFTVNVP